MGNQKTSGLTKRGGIWHIDKRSEAPHSGERFNKRPHGSSSAARKAY